jgi:hypothetical protein
MRSLDQVPRELDPYERELLLWLLPADRPGYASYRSCVEQWPVAAVGRRGEGNYILASPGCVVDLESPLPPLFAFGAVEHESGTVNVSIRESLGCQLEYEIEGIKGDDSRELRRWTFSEWDPSSACPSSRSVVREIGMSTTTGQNLDLVLCGRDHRIWVHESRSGVNVLIPVTSFYNELMLHTGIKDPAIALEPNRLFASPQPHKAADLIRAFASYNKERNRVPIDGSLIVVEESERHWFQRVVGAFVGDRKKSRR